MDHLGDAVEESTRPETMRRWPAGRSAKPIVPRIEEHELELGQRRRAHGRGTAGSGRGLMHADLDLDGDDVGKVASRGSTPSGGGRPPRPAR